MSARPFAVGDRYRFKNDVVEITEVIPELDFYDGRPAVRYAWLTEIDVDPAIREHSSREAGRLTGLARAEVFARTATFVEPAPTNPSTGAVTQPNPAPVDAATPSLVELDRRDEMRALLAEAIWRSTGGVGRLYDVGHTYAIDPFGAAEHILARFEVKAVTS